MNNIPNTIIEFTWEKGLIIKELIPDLKINKVKMLNKKLMIKGKIGYVFFYMYNLKTNSIWFN